MENKRIKEVFEKIGVVLSEKKIDQFNQYYIWLIKENKKLNLTAITEPEEVLFKHFVDSLLITQVVELKDYNYLVDIGSGAGFPGIPLKIVFPHLKVTLLDALNKRVMVLKEVVNLLELENVQVIHGRAEDLARTELRENFDIVVSRAVSQLNVLCEYCLPFVQLKGLFVAYKGQKVKEEVETSKKAIKLLGGEIIRVENQLDLTDQIKRGFVCIKKVEKTKEKYPRRAGKPNKNPL